jgi:hypothetical protein
MIVVSVDDGNGGQATGNIPITITPAPDAGSAALPPSRNPALFIQAIAAFGASHAWLTDCADAMAMPGSHLDLAAARQ